MKNTQSKDHMKRRSSRKKIVIAIDQSDYAEKVVKSAYDVAENIDADIYLLTIIETPEIAAAGELDAFQMKAEEENISQFHKKLIDDYFSGTTLLVESVVLHGNPTKKICEFAKKVDANLVVIGTRGFGKLQSKLLGSVSDKVIKECHCSVMIVRK